MELFRLMGTVLIDDQDAINALKKVDSKGNDTKSNLDKITEVGTKIGKAVVAGGAVAGGALAAMTVKITETTGAIKDSADRAGMSAEEFQKWSFAAEQSGMSAETLEKAMIKQQKAFSEAKTGSASMGEAYKQLGIDISSIGSSSEAFDQVMIKLGNMTDETQRNAIANDIFGKSYAELTPLLNEGGAGMDALKQKAVELGGVMSNDAVASGEQLGDTLDQLKLMGAGLFNDVATKLIPIVQQGADWIIAHMPEIEEVAGKAFNFIGDAIGFVTDHSNILIPVLAGLAGGFIALQIISTIKGLMDAFKTSTLLQTIAQQGLNTAMRANPMGVIITIIGLLIAAGVALYMNWDTVKEKAGKLWDMIKDVFDNIKNKVKGAVDAIKGFFNFDWKLPDIKLPHFKISGKFDLNPLDGDGISVPKIGVDWYAKGGIFSEPTIFNTPYGLKGVGDATSPEVVAPLSDLKDMLGLDNNKKEVNLNLNLNIDNFNNNNETDIEDLGERLAFEINRRVEAVGA